MASSSSFLVTGESIMKLNRIRSASLLLSLLVFAMVARAQFSSSLQGTVEDPSGALVADAKITLTNTATAVSQQTTTGAKGDYRFLSLAPGPYVVISDAKGFSTSKISVTLQTDQTMDVPVKLTLSSQSQTVEVSDRAPVLDTAESRTQLTIDADALDSLPLPGRDLLGLTSLAPGVTGLGVQGSGGNGQSNDNYAAETQVTASANGRSSVGNMFVLDGLDITSNITPGVLNLVPNPDTIQEATVQVNMFDVQYGRSSSIVQVMTTRSGASQYHFVGSEYYTANWLTARTEFQPKTAFPPFHSNNISATASGPIPLIHQMYFFTGWEPLLALTQSPSSVTYEDPAFTAWAVQNWPNAVGVKLLAQYPSSHATTTSVAKKGSDLYPTTCGTAAAANIPCTLPIVDNGVFNATNTRNGLQYNVRVDKYFTKDRAYANYYRTALDLGGPSVRAGHDQPQHYLVRSLQGNETHTFSPNTVNETAFGVLRMEGLINPTGPFHVPIITVSTAWGTQIGVSKADENYIQYHYVWHEALTHVYRSHSLKAGYEGFWGDSHLLFAPLNSLPTFSFQSVGDFLQDKVFQESGVSYNLLTGQQAGDLGGSYRIVGNTTGVYAQDAWRANKKLTLTYGVRWDNFGNPSPADGSIEANFFYGPGSTIAQQVANGTVKQVPHAFNHSITAWSPRAGFAWDLTGGGKWLVRGGFGLYHDWVTLGNVQNEFANPPAASGVTFTAGTTQAPVYGLGTSDVYPYGYNYPTIPSSGLNSSGGIVGVQSNIAGNDPNLKASNTMNYTVTLERGLSTNFSIAAGYSGSYSNGLFTDFAGHTTNAFYGVDINNFPGSLIANAGKLVRLNTNFGSIRYTVNGPTSEYNAFITEFKGRLPGRGFIDASYTHSSSYDDAGTYPTVQSNTLNYGQYWAPSNWDVPNRVSLAVSYELPHLHSGPGFLKELTNGWKPSAITILQSGTPFTVLQTAAYKAGIVPGSAVVTSAGDYNADGINSDLPNIPTYGYSIPTDRNSELGRGANLAPTPGSTGVFKALADFTTPATLPGEGNEVFNGYRNPGYANTDFALLKNTHIYERANLQLRLELYNIFNRPNLGGISSGLTSSTFGKVTSQYSPRFVQLGARFEF
jgi:hypothetical protein